MKCDNSDDNDRCLNNDQQLADIRRGGRGIMVERGKVGKEEGKMKRGRGKRLGECKVTEESGGHFVAI